MVDLKDEKLVSMNCASRTEDIANDSLSAGLYGEWLRAQESFFPSSFGQPINTAQPTNITTTPQNTSSLDPKPTPGALDSPNIPPLESAVKSNIHTQPSKDNPEKHSQHPHSQLPTKPILINTSPQQDNQSLKFNISPMDSKPTKPTPTSSEPTNTIQSNLDLLQPKQLLYNTTTSPPDSLILDHNPKADPNLKPLKTWKRKSTQGVKPPPEAMNTKTI
ncbi:early nodulin-like protein 15, partial [Striga asiatica]